MSRVILCTGERAKKPYYFSLLGVNIYTIEELCHSLRRSLDMLEENTIDREMALFISRELGLKERGDLLEQLVFTKADLKSRLVVVFCSSNYYNKDEIVEICDELERIGEMSVAGKRKRRADRFIAEGHMAEACVEYRNILAEERTDALSDKEYGDILHNLAVASAREADFKAAGELFRQAYERNHDPETLRSYLLSLRLDNREDEFVNEARRLGDMGRLVERIEEEISVIEDNLEQSGEMDNVDHMKILMQQGRLSEADRIAGDMIAGFKRAYRAG